MNDAELKPLLKGLIGCVAAVTEKQAIILEFLSGKLQGLTDAEKQSLLASAAANNQRVIELQASLKKL